MKLARWKGGILVLVVSEVAAIADEADDISLQKTRAAKTLLKLQKHSLRRELHTGKVHTSLDTEHRSFTMRFLSLPKFGDFTKASIIFHRTNRKRKGLVHSAPRLNEYFSMAQIRYTLVSRCAMSKM